MSPTLFKVLAAAIILVVTLICCIAPIRNWWKYAHSHSIALAEAFGGGIFLGVALFHMLPDATRDFHHILGQTHYPYANLLCAGGFMLLLGLENIILRFHQHHHNPIPYLLTAVLSVHALIEGGALGISGTLADTLLVFVAIMVHKGSESLALAAQLARKSILPKHAIMIFLFFSTMTPLGVLAANFLTDSTQELHYPLLAPIFNAVAAGTFLYIATLHKIHHQHIHEDLGNLKEFLAMTLGLASMAIVAIWI